MAQYCRPFLAYYDLNISMGLHNVFENLMLPLESSIDDLADDKSSPRHRNIGLTLSLSTQRIGLANPIWIEI